MTVTETKTMFDWYIVQKAGPLISTGQGDNFRLFNFSDLDSRKQIY